MLVITGDQKVSSCNNRGGEDVLIFSRQLWRVLKDRGPAEVYYAHLEQELTQANLLLRVRQISFAFGYDVIGSDQLRIGNLPEPRHFTAVFPRDGNQDVCVKKEAPPAWMSHACQRR